MSKRIITLGTWNENPIEWVVLKEDDFKLLVISRYEIRRMQFDSSNNNSWKNSSLRKFLNNDFFKKAFTDDEKKKILNMFLSDVDSKDDVFILTRGEVEQLLLKDGSDDYENAHYSSSDFRVWTRTKEGNGINTGYARGCWHNNTASGTFAVRPAMWIREK